MHEIITISVSHRANHLATQFFNTQEQYLYLKNDNPVQSSVFLNPTIDRLSKTVSYSPRALLWDAKTGTGSLGVHQYSQIEEDYYEFDKEDVKRNKSVKDNSIIFTHPRIPKSEYQSALDTGLTLPSLTPQLAKYWSDYSKLIYHPTSFNTLKDWYHDTEQPNKPDFQNLGERKFDDYNIGYTEFKESYSMDFFDNNLHYQLEACDTLQGFNLVTDFDNAWGGFSSSLLVELKDELPKSSIFTYGFNEDDPFTLAKDTLSLRLTPSMIPRVHNKIRATMTLSEESDLLFPLYVDSKLSNWENAGFSNRIFDSINSIFCQNNATQRKSMEYLSTLLKNDGENDRNIISKIIDYNNIDNQKTDHSYQSKILPYKNSPKDYHEFSKCLIERALYNKSEKKEENAESIMSKFNTVYTYPYNVTDTIPTALVKDRAKDEFELKLSMDEYSRNIYLYWSEMVSKYFKNDPDREDLKDQLANKASAYEYGWYDDEDSGDDY